MNMKHPLWHCSWKRSVLCLLMMTAVMPTLAQIDFRNLSLDAALKAAQAEKKLVFVDCYTSWCGPCKRMSNEEFVKPEAGNYFNPKYVCIKIDMEKGEGPAVGKKFSVEAYPTFLILNADGTLRGRCVGSATIEQFIDRVETAVSEQQGLAWYQKQFDEGARDSLFLRKYISLLEQNYMHPEVKTATLELLKGRTASEIVADKQLFSTFMRGGFDTSDELFLNVYKLRATAAARQGETAVKKLENTWQKDGLKCLVFDGKEYKGFDNGKFETYKQKMADNGVDSRQTVEDYILYTNATYGKDYPTMFKYVQQNMLQKDSEVNDRTMQQDLKTLSENYKDKKALKSIRQFVKRRLAFLEKKDTSGERTLTVDGRQTTLTGFFIDRYKEILDSSK